MLAGRSNTNRDRNLVKADSEAVVSIGMPSKRDRSTEITTKLPHANCAKAETGAIIASTTLSEDYFGANSAIESLLGFGL